MNAWITTFTGRKVNPLDIRPEDVHIDDIAHALACINRFGGHALYPMSVALHSMYVAWLVKEKGHPSPVVLQGLLHDAAEAYVGDMTKWMKEVPEMQPFRDAEARAHRSIMQVHLLPEELHPSVIEADRLMVRYEAEKLLPFYHLSEVSGYHKVTVFERNRISDIGRKIGFNRYFTWKTAETRFKATFDHFAERAERYRAAQAAGELIEP
jgi:hypothetical protein